MGRKDVSRKSEEEVQTSIRKTNESQVTLEGPEGRQPSASKMAGALSHSGQVSSEAVAVRGAEQEGTTVF